jgi:hypothetical protein
VGPYRYYFPCKYKPSDAAGHQLLTDNLRAVGLSHGVKLSRTGGGPGKGVYPMLCKYAVFYRSNAAAKGGTKTDDVVGYTYKADIRCRALSTTVRTAAHAELQENHWRRSAETVAPKTVQV